MAQADVVYADGMSIVWLGKISGANNISRSATTDIGIPLLRRMQARLGRPMKIALLGGPQGLAEKAGSTLVRNIDAELAYACHGFHEDWGSVLLELKKSSPDVVVVGMGMPQEAIWVTRHYDQLPDAPIVTCGGWFGFLAGDESRAPQWMQKIGLEWLYRTIHDPRRLARRYLTGLVNVARAAGIALTERTIGR